MKHMFCSKKIQRWVATVSLTFFIGVLGVFAIGQRAQAQFPVTVTSDIPFTAHFIGEKIEESAERLLFQTLGGVLWNTISNITLRASQAVAEDLAAGATGQSSKLEFRSFDKLTEDFWGNALAEVIGGLSEDEFFKGLGFNLCAPSIGTKINITGSLFSERSIDIPEPACNWQQLRDNWENLANSVGNGEILDNFQLSVDFQQSDTLTYITALDAVQREIENKKEEEERLRSLCQQINPRTHPVTKGFLESCSAVNEDVKNLANQEKDLREQGFQVFGDADQWGILLGTTLSTFYQTFTQKVLNHYMKKLVGTFSAGDLLPSREEALQSILDGVGDLRSARTSFTASFRGIEQPFRVETATYDLLSEFAVCPDAKYASLNNCVLDPGFLQAINQQMTVREAMDAGLLHGEWFFGYSGILGGSRVEPNYNEGYAISNMKKLRRARILPVGWEMAAELVPSKYDNQIFTLNKIVHCFEDDTNPQDHTLPEDCRDASGVNPLYHMVDPGWVLKSPLLQSKRLTYGQVINQESGGRLEQVTDFVDCVKRDEQGTCLQYGYCTQEANTWSFLGGAQCEAAFDSCLTLTDNTGNQITAVTKTMDPGVCDASNAGCLWMAANQDGSGNWLHTWNEGQFCDGANPCPTGFSCQSNACVSDPQAQIIYLNDQAPDCTEREEGCQHLLALQPFDPQDTAEDVFNSVQQLPQSPLGYEQEAQVFDFYMRLAPDYYNCYDADPNNDAPECGLYTNSCTQEQNGCELYTSILNANSEFSAVLQAQDYCPSQCTGYARYSQEATYFESSAFPLDFIPSTGLTCQVQDSGCTEFTNLDEVAQGGEGLEYYTRLRQCQKPAPDCATFFTWVGSDVTGFQLQSFNLKSNPNGTPFQVANPRQDLGSCQDANDALTNPNCKEFFDASGAITYAIFENTVSCSDDCHPLRKTRTITTSQECTDIGGSWNAQDATCDIEITDCTNSGGTWDTNVQACLYDAIPSQGRTCQANVNGCREYRGNTATNVFSVLKDDFDDEFAGSDPENWDAVTIGGQNAQAISISADSIVVGGKSLRTGGYMQYVNEDGAGQNIGVRDLITRGKTYTLRFIARSGSGQDTLQAWIGTIGGDAISFGGVSLTDEWATYEIGPVFFDRDVKASGENLTIQSSGNVVNIGTSVFIDDIELIEATDAIYLIEDSWATPLTCDTPQNLPGGLAQESMLGCQAYTDRDSDTHYVKEFSQLCPSNKVGCQGFVNTQNTNSIFAEDYNMGGVTDDDLTIPDDEFMYLVNDSRFYCNEEVMGCYKFGSPLFDNDKQEVTDWEEKYKINNPADYSLHLCTHEELFCKEYTTSAGNKFFKDPGTKFCEYKQIPGTFNPVRFSWFKVGTDEVCDLRQPGDYNGNISTNEAGNGCFYDDTRYEWYALDASNNRIACPLECVQQVDGTWVQPNNGNTPCDPGYRGHVGLCPLEKRECTKFIEPASGQGLINMLTGGNMETPYKRCSLNTQVTCDVDADCVGVGGGVCTDTNVIRGTWYKQSEVGGNNVDRVKFGDLGVNDDWIFEGNFSKRINVDAGVGNQVAYAYQVSQTVSLGNSYQIEAHVYPDQIAADDVFTMGLVLNDAQQIYGRLDLQGSDLVQDQWNTVVFDVVDGPGVGGLDINTPSNRLFWSVTSTSGATEITMYLDDVRLVESNQFTYVNDASISDEGCNGAVDYKQGCLLFNDTSDASLTMNAKATGEVGSPNAQCGQQGQPPCDTNRLLKVDRDRVCREFLGCTSEASIFDPLTNSQQRICQNLGRFRYDKQGKLAAVFPKGLCVEVPADPNDPLITSDRECLTDNQCQADEFCDTRLTPEIYQDRGTGFAGSDYTGMSIPNLFPIEQLKQYNYKMCEGTNDRCISDDDCTGECVDNWRITYFDPIIQNDLGMNGNAVKLQGLEPIQSSEPLLLSATQDQGWTRVKVCRGFPESESPINEQFADNPGMDNASIGAPDNDVDCEYLKVETTFDTYYYQASGGNMSIAQIKQDYNIDPAFNLQINDVDIKRGFRGYCLEESPGLRLYGSDSERVCLTWHPLDLLSGDFDFYANTKEAGFYVNPDERFYCMESQMLEFRQTVWHQDDTRQWFGARNGDRCADAGYWTAAGGGGNCPNFGSSWHTGWRFWETSGGGCREVGGGGEHSTCCIPKEPGWHLYDGTIGPRLAVGFQGGLGCHMFDHREKSVEACATVAAVGDATTGLVVGHTNKLNDIVIDQGGNYLGASETVKIEPKYCSNDNTQFCETDLDCAGGTCEVVPGYRHCSHDKTILCDDDADCGIGNTCTYAITYSTGEAPFGRIMDAEIASPDQWTYESGPFTIQSSSGYVNNVKYTSSGVDWHEGLPSSTNIFGQNTLLSSFGCTGVNCGDPCNPNGTLSPQCPLSLAPNVETFWPSATPTKAEEEDAFRVIKNAFEEVFLSYDTYEWHYDKAPRNDQDDYDLCAGGADCEYTNAVNENRLENTGFLNKLIAAGEYPQVKQVDLDPNIASFVDRFSEGADGITVNSFNSGNVFSPIKGINVATVTFYAYDPTGEHMPLSEITVDWGDGTSTFSGGYTSGGSLPNRRDKCEPEMIDLGAGLVPNPAYNFGHQEGACIQNTTSSSGFFSFTHTYTCVPQGFGWDPGNEWCEFTPKVRVVDNWGLCSNGTAMEYNRLIDLNRVCDYDNYQAAQNEGTIGPWVVYGGSVIVQP